MVIMLEPSPDIIEGIIGKLKTNGMFDEMRRNCLADIDTKPAFQNLKQRVENYVNALLSAETWTPALNKNQLRTKVRSSVMRSGMLNSGIEHILHQVVDAKMYTEFLPKITDFIAENHEALHNELTPQPEANPLHDVPESMQLHSEGSVNLKDDNTSETDIPQTSDKAGPSNENDANGPEIPEGAANTLRALVQSLMTTNIQSLLTIGSGEEKTEETKTREGTSPSIDPSQIESFTDEENDEIRKKHNKSPESENSSTSPSESESVSPEKHAKYDEKDQVTSSECEEDEEEDGDEDLRKVDTDASFDSSGGIPDQSDCEVVVDEGASDDSTGKNETVSLSFEEGQVNIVNIDEAFGNSVEEIEVLDLAGSEHVLMEDYVVAEEQSLEVGEVAVAAPSDDEEEEMQLVHHSHREKKRKHKKHRRRRHSTDEDSDESARVATPSERDSSEEARLEGAEPTKSRSRKKKKKKRSKKLKRSKSKTRDSSQEMLQWDSSSEYKRSSLSPSHPDIALRHSFIPSPPLQPTVRFGDDNRSVKVEPAFMQMTPRFRDPYALDRNMEEPRTIPDFQVGHPEEGMSGFPMRPSFHPRSPSHYPPHMHPRFSPPRFTHGHSRFSPPFSRMPYSMRPSSPPRRYSPTFDYYRHPSHPIFDAPGPPRSPPHQRRFSPPRQMSRFPGGMPPPRMFPGPPEERFMMRPGPPGPRGMPAGPMMRSEIPPGAPVDMRRPPMR